MASNLMQFQDRSFHYQPVDYLLAVVDSTPVAEAAIADLLAAEFPGLDLHVWYGPDGEKGLDPTGKDHGTASYVWRQLQRASGEHAVIKRYADELRRGHVCIGVHCQLKSRKTLAQTILEGHGAHFLTFLSLGAVEVLKP